MIEEPKTIEELKALLLNVAKKLNLKAYCFLVEFINQNGIEIRHHSLDHNFLPADKLWLAKLLELDASNAVLNILRNQAHVINPKDLQ